MENEKAFWFSGFGGGVVIYCLTFCPIVDSCRDIEPPPAEDEGLALVVDTYSDTLIKVNDKTWLAVWT